MSITYNLIAARFLSPTFSQDVRACVLYSFIELCIDDIILTASSAIWTLNPFTRALNGEHLSPPDYHCADLRQWLTRHTCLATLTTQDGSEEKPSLAYDPARNMLSFTGHFNTPAEYPVVRASSFLLTCCVWLTWLPSTYTFPIRRSFTARVLPLKCDS